MLQYVAVCCSVMAASKCSVLQCVAVCECQYATWMHLLKPPQQFAFLFVIFFRAMRRVECYHQFHSALQTDRQRQQIYRYINIQMDGCTDKQMETTDIQNS